MEVNKRVPLLKEEEPKETVVIRPRYPRDHHTNKPAGYRVLYYLTAVVGLLVLCSLVYRLLDVYVFTSPTLSVAQLEVKKCPGCAGQSLCPAFFRGDVHLAGIYRPRLAHHIADQPPSGLDATMGLYESMKSVRLHRLGSPAEPRTVDEAVCRRGLQQGYQDASPLARAQLACIPHLAIWRWRPTNNDETDSGLRGQSVDLPLNRRMVVAPSFHSTRENDTAESAERDWTDEVMSTAFAPATRCASDRMFALLQTRFRERTSFGAETRWPRFDELMLLFNLAIDPQPVISQAFPRSENWPFPTHLGACGRWVVQANHGVPLDRFCGSPLWLRLRILSNLLTLPDRLERPPIANRSTKLLPHEHNHLTASADDDLTAGYTVYLANFDLGTTFLVDPKTYEVTVSGLRHAILVDTQTLMDLGFPESVTQEYTVPKSANEHLIRGMTEHRCLGQVKQSGDAGGSTPPCVHPEHADALCSRVRSDHNLWAICATLLYSGGDGGGDLTLSCPDYLQGLPAELVQALNRCVHQADLRREAFVELRTLVDKLVDANPVPRGW